MRRSMQGRRVGAGRLGSLALACILAVAAAAGSASVAGPAEAAVTQPAAQPLGQVEPNRATTGLTALPPRRILDTRSGLGGARRLAAGRTIRLVVAGRGGVPTTALGAVLNLTAVAPAAGGYATVWPAGSTRPAASTLNYRAGRTVANLATVRLGTGGAVDVYVSGGPVDLLADVSAQLSAVPVASAAGRFRPLAPTRILDTRSGLGGSRPGPQGTLTLQVTGRGGVPAAATAVILNVTAVAPAGGGYLTAYPTGAARPTASNVSFARGVTTAGRVVVSVGTGGRVSIVNGSSGATHLLGDVAGYVVGASGPRVGSSGFVPMVPRRLLDTRVAGSVQPGRDSLLLDADGVAGLPTTGVTALALNVTVVGEHVPGYLTTYPDDRARPSVSDVNFAAFQTAANLVVVKPSETGDIAVFTSTPYVRVVVDVTGYFTGAFVVPTQTWRSAVGAAYGAPVTDGRNVLVGLSSRPTGDVATVRALEPTTGAVRWERRVEGFRMFDGVVRAGVPGVSLMTTFTSTGLTALSAEGAVLWEAFGSGTSFGAIRPAAAYYVVPFAESTAEGSRGGVAVIRSADGTLVWRRYGSYLGSSGDLVYFAEPASSFRAYRIADGTVAFDADPTIGLLPPLTPAGPRLLTVLEPLTGSLCSGSGRPEIGALSASTGAVLWRHSLRRYSCAPTIDPPLVYGSSVYYGTSAGLRRHDLATGATVVARENVGSPSGGDRPVVHGGVLYATVSANPAGDDEGGVYAYDPVTLDRLGLLVRGSLPTVLDGVLHVMDVDPTTGVATLVRLG